MRGLEHLLLCFTYRDCYFQNRIDRKLTKKEQETIIELADILIDACGFPEQVKVIYVRLEEDRKTLEKRSRMPKRDKVNKTLRKMKMEFSINGTLRGNPKA